MGLRTIATGSLGIAALAAYVATSAVAGTEQLVGTGTEIPGTARKLGLLGEAYVDGENVVFAGEDDLGAQGFGVLSLADANPSLGLKWFPAGPFATGLKCRSCLSSQGFVYGAEDAAGTPTIFGVTDIANWNPVVLAQVGDTLPGPAGPTITELSGFDLAGKKLVLIAKKAGGEGLYSILDFQPAAYVPIVDTDMDAPVGGGLFVKVDSPTTTENSVFFTGFSATGAGIYGTTDGTSLLTLADTNQEIPIENVTLNYEKIRMAAWTGKKAVFVGSAGDDEGVFYAIDPFIKLEIKTASDTLTPLPGSAAGQVFPKIHIELTATDTEIAVLAEGTDQSVAAYMGTDDLSWKVLNTNMDLLGKKIASIAMTGDALGSLVTTVTYDDASQGVLLTAIDPPIDLLPLPALALLLICALGTILWGWRNSTRSA